MRLTILIFCFIFSNAIQANISNFSSVIDGVYRGGWLKHKKNDFSELNKLGVDTIINMDFFFKDNKANCSRYKMTCEHHPLLLFPLYDIFYKF